MTDEITRERHAVAGSGASSHDTHGPSFWIGLAIGTMILGFGVRGALHVFHGYSSRFVFAKYVIGFDFVHDLIVAPIAFSVGWLTTRMAPAKLRAPLTFAMFASAIMIAVAWYPLHRSAAYKGNPTFQPLNYATSLATTLAVVWTIAAIWATMRFLGHNKRVAR